MDESKAYKGFDLNFKCRDHQFAVGESYAIDGDVKACERGFHACEHPLDVLRYYPAGSSRYCRVTQSGQLSSDGTDSKRASSHIRIDEEITLVQLIEDAISKTIRESVPSGAASATGYSGAALATGDSGAALATGYSGAASATGYSGAASATGVRGKVRGASGCALFLVYRDPGTDEIKHSWAGIAGRDGIKPLAWYTLAKDGKPVEVGGDQ